MSTLGLDSDRRPHPPTYRVTDVTGWSPEEVEDLYYEDGLVQDQYAADLAAWEERHGASTADDGSGARASASRDAMKTSSDPSGRRQTTTEGASIMHTTTNAAWAAPGADERLPAWATGATAWEWLDFDNVWRRFAVRAFTHEGRTVSLTGLQTSSVPGEVLDDELSLDVADIDGVILEGPALIRGLAAWLTATADALEENAG